MEKSQQVEGFLRSEQTISLVWFIFQVVQMGRIPIWVMKKDLWLFGVFFGDEILRSYVEIML